MRFDTRGVPEAHRVDYFRTAMQQVLSADCAIEPAPVSVYGFGVSMHAMELGDVGLVDLSGTPYSSSRQGAGREQWVSVLFQLQGCSSVHSRRKSTQLVTGDACLIPPAHEVVVVRETDFRQVILDLRSDLVDEILPQWQDRLAQRLEAGRAGLQAASQLVRFIADQQGVLDGDCREHLSAALLKLLPRMLGDAGADQDTSASVSRMTAYHRKRVEQFVLEHIREAHLSVEVIAQELNLSRRYIHKLFDSQGPTVMQWVMERRLDSARSDLMRRDGRSIGEVAYSWGFNSLSHFSRAFKKRFGVAPSGR